MEDFRLTTMRIAAQVVARWQRDYPERAEGMVRQHVFNIDLYPVPCPEFRDAYSTAFGQ